MPKPEPTIIIDTREQTPFTFAGPARVAGLKTADYTIEGYEDIVGLERKSLDDLIACLSSQRERFERELLRARDFQ